MRSGWWPRVRALCCWCACLGWAVCVELAGSEQGACGSAVLFLPLLCGLEQFFVEQIFVLLFANGAVPPVASLAAMLWTAGRLEVPLLRGTCAIDDGAFAVRGVQAAVGFEEAKYSGFAGSTVPATPPIPAGSDYVTCDLTGDFHEHPYAFNFTDVHGASARCLPLSVSLSQRSLA